MPSFSIVLTSYNPYNFPWSFTKIIHPASIIWLPNNEVSPRREGFSLTPQPKTWRTRISLFVWVSTFDLSGMGGSNTGNATAGIVLRIMTTTAPPVWQSRNTFWWICKTLLVKTDWHLTLTVCHTRFLFIIIITTTITITIIIIIINNKNNNSEGLDVVPAP